MRVVIQRVSKASVTIDGQVHGEILNGLMILLGIEESDEVEDVEWLTRKIVQLRIFADAQGVMNLSVQEAGGSIMVISQFTLHASTRKGNRPSYIRAARPEHAVPLYEQFIENLEILTSKKVVSGVFGAMMDISMVNTGPVTIIIDSKQRE
ncbi:MAG: D-tyrosyl-tRNA(Tyr) deacylase [Lentimicrobiaceae bacterium]|nr:D-tyrosyl-tRNA(Tyr) deacylase [Lentimicrobiaceae bacterium]